MKAELRTSLIMEQDKITYHVGAQNDQIYIITGAPPSADNDYPNHDADRTPIAKVYRVEDARRIAACLNACKGFGTDLLELASSGSASASSSNVCERAYDLSREVAEQQARKEALEETIKIIEAEDCDQTEYLCHALYRCIETIRALIEREDE